MSYSHSCRLYSSSTFYPTSTPPPSSAADSTPPPPPSTPPPPPPPSSDLNLSATTEMSWTVWRRTLMHLLLPLCLLLLPLYLLLLPLYLLLLLAPTACNLNGRDRRRLQRRSIPCIRPTLEPRSWTQSNLL